MSGRIDRPMPAARIRGGLIGLLVGDALGVPYEFKPPSAIPPRDRIEMRPPAGCPPTYGDVPPGTWSDDGAQALCLAASLLDRDGLDADDLGARLLGWWQRGEWAVGGHVFDIGLQTRRALDRIARGAPALQAGETASPACGNGSLMRVLPLALWHRGEDAALVADAMTQSRVTHGHPRAQLCCALVCLVARRLLEGADPDTAWSVAIDGLRHGVAHDAALRDEYDDAILASPLRAAPRGEGYVVDTLWSARHCLRQPDYASAVREAIALGHDTDTTAAVAGGLAGIAWGLDAIPPHWRAALRDRARADAIADALVARQAAQQTDGPIAGLTS